VINLGSISVGNATLVVANVLTCNNHSQNNTTQQQVASTQLPRCVTVGSTQYISQSVSKQATQHTEHATVQPQATPPHTGMQTASAVQMPHTCSKVTCSIASQPSTYIDLVNSELSPQCLICVCAMHTA
jgi:hypothetical protein